MEAEVDLNAQVAHAKALLDNGPRITELMAERERLASALGELEKELSGLLSAGQLDLPLLTKRATQKCSKCGKEGHTKRTCTGG